ncbi:MAG: SDR family oxidoreductase [Planctomycetes bacterium]|nr:SDR family oxidoreductase [Planctomycetota bacterium]
MALELEGKKAIVTGSSLGIGRAIAIELARNGCDVAINYRKHEEEARKIAEEIRTIGRQALAIKADVSVFKEVENLVTTVLSEFKRVDILINNAGVNRDGVIWKMTEENWDTVIDINLKGYFNTIRFTAPVMKEQNFGKIVNITSINGLRGKFGQTNYSAAKAGIVGLTKSLAKELGKFNVNVNAVAPGMIETEMMAGLPPEIIQKAKDETVLGRIAMPEDIANVVAFLCTERAKHITGEVIKVDGGQYI